MEIRIKTMDEITDGRVKIEIVADREVVLTGFEGVAGVESCGHTPDVVQAIADRMTEEKDRQVSQLIRESRDMASALDDTRAELDRWRDNAEQMGRTYTASEVAKLQAGEARLVAEPLERRIEELAGQVEHLTQTLALRDGELVSANEQRDQARRAHAIACDFNESRAQMISRLEDQVRILTEERNQAIGDRDVTEREERQLADQLRQVADRIGPLKMALVQIGMLVNGEVMDRAVDAAWGHVDAQSMADMIRRTREILNNLPASPE